MNFSSAGRVAQMANCQSPFYGHQEQMDSALASIQIIDQAVQQMMDVRGRIERFPSCYAMAVNRLDRQANQFKFD